MTKIIGKLTPSTYQPIAYFYEHVPAGFPSPAQGYSEASIDLNELCIKHPNATFLVRASGLSMVGVGIYPNDLLVVDRSLQADSGDIIVCSLHGEFTVKELCLEPSPQLIAHNPDFENICLKNAEDFEVFGVVTNVIRDMKQAKKR